MEKLRDHLHLTMQYLLHACACLPNTTGRGMRSRTLAMNSIKKFGWSSHHLAS